MSYSYQTSKVHTSNWHEEAAWRPANGERPAASLGARRFGQAADLTPAQTLARTNGHDTRAITSWGDDAGRFDTSRELDSSRPSRRAIVGAPNATADIKHALAGDGLPAHAPPEPHFYATGQVATPGTGKAMLPESYVSASHQPFPAPDDAPPHGPAVLYDAMSGVAKSTGRGLGVVHTEQVLPASAAPFTGAADDYQRRESVMKQQQDSARRASNAASLAQYGAPPPPPAGAAAEVLDALHSLSEALRSRQTSLEAVFKPYDPSGSGVVSMADLLRVFRSAGVSPSPALLRALPAHLVRNGTSVLYPGLLGLLAAEEDVATGTPLSAPLMAANSGTALSTNLGSRRHSFTGAHGGQPPPPPPPGHDEMGPSSVDYLSKSVDHLSIETPTMSLDQRLSLAAAPPPSSRGGGGGGGPVSAAVDLTDATGGQPLSVRRLSGYGPPQFATSASFDAAVKGVELAEPPHHLPARSPHRLSNPCVPASVRFENARDQQAADPAMGLASPISKSVPSPSEHARQLREADARSKRVHRLLLERCARLGRSTNELWAEMRPSAGGVLTLAALGSGLSRLGLTLGQADLDELAMLLAPNGERLGGGTPVSGPSTVVRYEDWQRVFASAQADWAEAPKTERNRRLTVGRLQIAIQSALGNDYSGLVAWLSARDRHRRGRVTIETFRAGLRSFGVVLSDADVALAAAELDPHAGANEVNYGKLAQILAQESPAACPMPC